MSKSSTKGKSSYANKSSRIFKPIPSEGLGDSVKSSNAKSGNTKSSNVSSTSDVSHQSSSSTSGIADDNT
jgi:hypothetical protein